MDVVISNLKERLNVFGLSDGQVHVAKHLFGSHPIGHARFLDLACGREGRSIYF